MDESIYIGRGVSSVEYWLSWSAGLERTIVVTLDGLFRVKLKTAWLPTPFASFPFTSPHVRRRVPPDSVSTLLTEGINMLSLSVSLSHSTLSLTPYYSYTSKF